MNITKEQLKALIKEAVEQQLKEQALSYKDIVPGADGEFYKYAEKLDKFLMEVVEEAEALHDEGDKLIRDDILGGHDSSVKAAERNRYINRRVSLMHQLKGYALNILETLKREI